MSLRYENMEFQSVLKSVVVVFAVTIAFGCADKDKAETITQAAAKVNSDEITVHQINSVLARTPNIAPDAMDSTKREVLNKLIDQQIAKQAAIEKKLDRSAGVMQRIETARTEILARSYIESIVSEVPKPTIEEMKKYYAEHPELFAKRRVFNIQQIFVPSNEGPAEKLQQQVTRSRSMEDVTSWLNLQKIKFTASRGLRAAESIPLELLSKLHAMKDGEMRLIETGNGVSIFRVIASQTIPVDEATAAPRIMQFLFNQRASEATAAEMKKIRDRTEITLLGEFVETAAAAEARIKAQADTKARELEKLSSDAELEAQTRAEVRARVAAEAQANADALANAREERLATKSPETQTPADSKSGSAPPNKPQLQQENIDSGLRGLR